MTDSGLDFDGLQELLWTFAMHRVITVAGRTGILRRLAAGSTTPETVANELELEPAATGKVIRALATLGIVRADGDEYLVVDGLRRLFTPGVHDLVPFFEHSHGMYESWGASLEPWLRGEGWSKAPRDAESVHRFGAAMRAIGGFVSESVAAHLELDGVRRLLDVGGGFGQYAQAICRRSPDLEATVLDCPEVVETAVVELRGTDFEGRIRFVGGDYLTSDYGTGFDLVVLANVIHQELPDAAAEMLRRSAVAAAPGGRVAVVDFAIDDERREHVLGCLFAINMRSFGDTYTAPEISGWMEGAGLERVSVEHLGPHRWIITGRKPNA